MGTIIAEMMELIYPSNIYCIGCGSIIDKSRAYALCDMCIEEYRFAIDNVCEKCGKPLAKNRLGNLCRDCLEKERFFDKGFCCMAYGKKERLPIFMLKYGEQAYIGKKLGELLYDRITIEELEIDFIISVPLSKKKMRKRGYNQAEIIAKEVARRMNVPYLPALIRNKDTKAMSKLSKFEREENLKKAFTIFSYFSKMICGRSVLLVDDIFTTGSTADECSKVLKAAGASSVYLGTIAAGSDIIMEN